MATYNHSYFNPAIIAPESLDLLPANVALSHAETPLARGNLIAITKLLQVRILVLCRSTFCTFYMYSYASVVCFSCVEGSVK